MPSAVGVFVLQQQEGGRRSPQTVLLCEWGGSFTIAAKQSSQAPIAQALRQAAKHPACLVQ